MIRGVKSGKIYRVKNKDKQGSANDHYNMIVIEFNDGSINEILLTDSDVVRGMARAKKNKEDIPSYSLEDNCSGCWPALILISAISSGLGYLIRHLNIF